MAKTKQKTSKLPKRGARSKRKPRADVLERLRPEEASIVLRQLLDAESSLRPRVLELATALVTTVDVEQIAEKVERRLDDLDITDVGDRAGRHPGGYVEPVEAAWEVLEEVVQPFIDDAVRLAELGHAQAACDALQGLMTGLHAVQECSSGLLAFAPDFPVDTAGYALSEVKRALGRKPGKVAMLRQVVSELPDWSDWTV